MDDKEHDYQKLEDEKRNKKQLKVSMQNVKKTGKSGHGEGGHEEHGGGDHGDHNEQGHGGHGEGGHEHNDESELQKEDDHAHTGQKHKQHHTQDDGHEGHDDLTKGHEHNMQIGLDKQGDHPETGLEEVDNEKAKQSLSKLGCVMVICLIFMAAEIVGGVMAGSLAILTDAAHLMSDVAGFGISIFAIWLGQKEATVEFSYGWARAEIIGALVSVILIWGLTAWLVKEAIFRIQNPEHVDGWIMFGTAVFGLCCNIIMAKVLHGQGGGHDHGGGGDHDEEGEGHGEHDGGGHDDDDHGDKPKKKKKMSINEYAAFIHVLGDLVQSVGVIIASIVILVKQDWEMADPISTLIFAVLVMMTTIKITKACIKTLMEASPEGMDLLSLKKDLLKVDGVKGLHCMHCWDISDGKPALTVHLVSEECTNTLMLAMEVCKKYEIMHATIQVENCCDQQTMDKLGKYKGKYNFCMQKVHGAINYEKI